MRVFGGGVPCGAFVLPCRPVLRLGGGVQAALLLAGAVAGVWAMLLPHDVSELVLEDKGVAYMCYRGQKQPARLGAGSLMVPRWACLSWQLEGGGSVAQVLLPDSLSAEDWRFFYVWAQLWQKD